MSLTLTVSQEELLAFLKAAVPTWDAQRISESQIDFGVHRIYEHVYDVFGDLFTLTEESGHGGWFEGKETDIALSDCDAWQSFILSDTVAQFVAEGIFEGEPHDTIDVLPFAIKFADVQFIIDGHHRAIAKAFVSDGTFRGVLVTAESLIAQAEAYAATFEETNVEGAPSHWTFAALAQSVRSAIIAIG
jgi:hypothetical protein